MTNKKEDHEALSQTGVEVTDEMVERACKMASTFEDYDSVWPDDYDNADEVRSLARRMITAALLGDA